MSNAETTELLEHLLSQRTWARRLARGLVREDAEDIVQETWMAALRRPPERGRPLRPWLASIVRNLARDRARSLNRQAARQRDMADEPVAASAEDLLARMQVQRLLAELVSALEEPIRRTVLLRYFEGLSSAEIARATGEPAGTVRWRLKVGLDRLRQMLEARYGGGREKWLPVLLPLVGKSSTATQANGEAPAGPAPRFGALAWALGGAVLVLGTMAVVLVARPPVPASEGTRAEPQVIVDTSSRTPPTPTRGGGPLPRFLAAAPAAEATCQEELRRLRLELHRTEGSVEFFGRAAAFAKAAPNELAERTFAPVVERAHAERFPRAARPQTECRGKVCRVSTLVKRGGGDTAPMGIQMHPLLVRRIVGSPFLEDTLVSRDGAHEVVRLSLYLRLALPSGEEKPAGAPPFIESPPNTPVPQGLEACRRELEALHRRMEELEREEPRAFRLRHFFEKTKTENAPLQTWLEGEVRRVLADPGTTVVCRSRICQVHPAGGPTQGTSRAIALDKQLGGRLDRQECCKDGLFLQLKSGTPDVGR